MNVIPFPRARQAPDALPQGWPEGQVGAELEGLARIIHDRGERIGKPCTLDKARRAALAALLDMEADRQESLKRAREDRQERIAELLVDRAERAGIALGQVVTNAGKCDGRDPTLQRIMAATQREAEARIARSKQ